VLREIANRQTDRQTNKQTNKQTNAGKHNFLVGCSKMLQSMLQYTQLQLRWDTFRISLL